MTLALMLFLTARVGLALRLHGARPDGAPEVATAPG